VDPLRADAAARVRRIALGARHPDPAVRADVRAALADARTALCIARGVALDEIDPASGHDLSRAAYENARASWRRHVAMHGFSDEYDRPAYEAAFDWWSARRPQYTGGDDWLAEIHKPELEGAQD